MWLSWLRVGVFPVFLSKRAALTIISSSKPLLWRACVNSLPGSYRGILPYYTLSVLVNTGDAIVNITGVIFFILPTETGSSSRMRRDWTMQCRVNRNRKGTPCDLGSRRCREQECIVLVIWLWANGIFACSSYLYESAWLKHHWPMHLHQWDSIRIDKEKGFPRSISYCHDVSFPKSQKTVNVFFSAPGWNVGSEFHFALSLCFIQYIGSNLYFLLCNYSSEFNNFLQLLKDFPRSSRWSTACHQIPKDTIKSHIKSFAHWMLLKCICKYTLWYYIPCWGGGAVGPAFDFPTSLNFWIFFI